MIFDSVDVHSFLAGLTFGWMVMLFGAVVLIQGMGRE